jgi:very-short-patch-repair endonuclease
LGGAAEGLPLSSDKSLAFLAYDKALVRHAREGRGNPTPAESLIWNKVLRHRQFHAYKFLRQKPLGPYIVDFYCAELRLVIEIDGDSHAQQVKYDEARSDYLRGLGLSVIRYANRDVLRNIEGVFMDLQSRIGIGNETGATRNRVKRCQTSLDPPLSRGKRVHFPLSGTDNF